MSQIHNLRSKIEYVDNYYEINREERNIAAILYHVLLINQNLQRFLEKYGEGMTYVEDEAGIYFEYAFIRDLWNSIRKKRHSPGDEALLRRDLILDLLKPSNRIELERISPGEFNEYFGAVRVYPNQISSPAVWSIRKFHTNIQDPNDFLETCKFKWCFNAKPDIVVHTSKDHAICIEAKYESGEGRYPGGADRKIFLEKLKPIGKDQLVGQLEIQEKIMDLLGINSKFMFLVKNKLHLGEQKSEMGITWNELFEFLDTSGCPPFVSNWIEIIQKNHR